MDKPNCYHCRYRGDVAGDAHSCCEYPGTKTGILDFFASENPPIAKKLNIKGHETGIRKGWFAWPVNFDPTWLLSCDGFKAKAIQGEE